VHSMADKAAVQSFPKTRSASWSLLQWARNSNSWFRLGESFEHFILKLLNIFKICPLMLEPLSFNVGALTLLMMSKITSHQNKIQSLWDVTIAQPLSARSRTELSKGCSYQSGPGKALIGPSSLCLALIGPYWKSTASKRLASGGIIGTLLMAPLKSLD